MQYVVIGFAVVLVAVMSILSHSPYYKAWLSLALLVDIYVVFVPGVLLGISLFNIQRQNKTLKAMKLRLWYMVLHLLIEVFTIGLTLIFIAVIIITRSIDTKTAEISVFFFDIASWIIIYVVVVTAKTEEDDKVDCQHG